MSDLPPIKILPFPESQYFKEAKGKKQIIIHHTASGRGSDGDYKHWLNTPERIATCIIINEDGTCVQLFNSTYWGHHIGLKHANNKKLNEESVAVELDSWGGLTYDQKTKQYKSYTGQVVPTDQVIEYPKSYRGYRFFQRYTAEQIESLRKLLIYWHETYDIDISYNEDMWDVSQRAIEGEEGVWSHGSFRKDKSDCHPQPELIEMLKNLENGKAK